MKKLFKYLSGSLLTVLLTFILIACGDSEIEGADTANAGEGKIAFVTGTGGLGDGAFNDLGYAGMEMLMEEGIAVDTAEPTALADIEGIIEHFAYSEEYSLIISMGGDSVDSVLSVAEQYPDQPMLVVDGLTGNEHENVTGLLLSQSDASFIVGAYAALMQKEGLLENSQGKDTIGVVGGMDIPIIRSAITGYEAGAKYINPDIEVLVSFVGDWNNPGAGSELAKTMISQGADVIFSAAGASGLGALEAAAEEGYYGLGYDGNQNDLYPDSIIASGYRDTANIIYNLSKDALSNKFEGGDLQMGLQDEQEAVQLTTEGSNIETPQEILDRIEELKAELHNSSVKIPDEQDKIDEFLEEFGHYED